MIRMLLAASVALSFLSATHAQNCMQYPKGPERFQCVSRAHPGGPAKLQRCKEEAEQMGLRGGAGAAGGLKQYVQACMHR